MREVDAEARGFERLARVGDEERVREAPTGEDDVVEPVPARERGRDGGDDARDASMEAPRDERS